MRSRAPMALLASLAACSMVPAVASAADSLKPYSAQVTAHEAATLEERGFDVGEGGFDDFEVRRPEGRVRRDRASRSRELEKAGIDAAAARRRQARREVRGARRQPEPVLQRLPHVLRARRHRRRDEGARGRQPGRHEARADRHLDARQADLRDQDDRRRAQRARRHAARGAVLGHQPRARVDRGRDGPPPAGLVRRAQERPEDQGADPDARAVVPADPEPGRLRLHLHLRRGLGRGRGPVRLPHGHRLDEPLLAQDDARQQRQRHLRRQPGRRGPEPQLPGQARHRRGGRLQQLLLRHLPRPVRAVGAREPRGRPPAAARAVRAPTSTGTRPASCC